MIGETRLLFICLPGLWALFSSRWGSYLPREPIFFTDIFLMISFFVSINRSILRIKGIFLLRLFLIYVTVIFISRLDLNYGVASFRDLAPYLYLSYAIIVAQSLDFSNIDLSKKIFHFSFIAIFLHFIWVAFTFITQDLINIFPLVSLKGDIALFSIRPDFDSGLLIVLAGIIISGHSVIKSKWFNLFITIVCIYLVIALESRAAFIALVAVIIYSYNLKIRKNKDFSSRSITRIFLVLIAILLMLFVNQTIVGEKFQSLFQIEKNTALTNSGTANARINAWKSVLAYQEKDLTRIVFGVGFGPDYLAESGALRQLTSDIRESRLQPRHPHNFWLNTLARLGLVGILILPITIFSNLKQAMKIARKRSDPLLVLGILIVIAILPIATLGVVLESPFGAIAFSFAFGIIVGKLNMSSK